MKNIPYSFVVAIALILIFFSAFLVWGVPYFFRPPSVVSTENGFGSTYVRARISRIIEEGTINLGGHDQPYQVMMVDIQEGEYQGIPMQIDYGKREVQPIGIHFKIGDEIYVTIDKGSDNVVHAYYIDYNRSNELWILIGVFVVAMIIMGRWKGVGSVLGLMFSMAVIIGYVIPHVLSGEDPVRVSLIGSAILLGATLYLTYGWNLKTHASVVSMALSLLLTGALTVFFVGLTRLTGMGDENASYLMQLSTVSIDLRGLLLGGMIIGALGVLADLVTTQSAAAFEIHDANSALGFRTIFEKTMRIGQDHVAATVNTLVLAYTGASLPLLLIFSLSSGNYGMLVNMEFITEEVVRTLVGSLGLVAAVPISSFVATAIALYSHRLGAWRALLGTETGDGPGHGHHHA